MSHKDDDKYYYISTNEPDESRMLKTLARKDVRVEVIMDDGKYIAVAIPKTVVRDMMTKGVGVE